MFVYTIDHIIALVVIGGFALIFLCLWLLVGAIKLWMGLKSVCKELFSRGDKNEQQVRKTDRLSGQI